MLSNNKINIKTGSNGLAMKSTGLQMGWFFLVMDALKDVHTTKNKVVDWGVYLPKVKVEGVNWRS